MALNAQGQMVPDAPITGWQVVSQQERTLPGPQGTIEDVVVVTFRMADGTTGTVNVPKAQYNAQNVRAAVANYAARLAEVSGLKG